jgi:hypothetical protein
MSLCTVSELRSTLGVGTLYQDSVLQEACDAADAVLLPMLWTPTQYAIAHSNIVGEGTLYFNNPVTDVFYIGQSVTISNCGTKYAGTKTITAVGTYSISVATTHTGTTTKHPIDPYGNVVTESYTDWTADSAIQESALMIAVDIWQARTATLGGANVADFQPSPWRMSANLLAKVRGLTAHALSPNSMVG